MSDAFQTPENAAQYWRSLGELENSEEFVKQLEAEFPDEASVPVDGMSRRRFLSLMAASAALVGMAGCRWPREEIVPFGKRPEDYQPGKVKRFATAFTVGEAIKPVLVTSFDGRPIKVEGSAPHGRFKLEGNPRDGRWGTDAHSQAEILSLYDPDRSKSPRRKVGGFWRGATWGEFETEIQAELARTNGEGLAVLLPESASVVETEALNRLVQRYPAARVYRHEPISRENERLGFQMATASNDVSPLPRLGQVIVDLESGFLTERGELAAQFAALRTPGSETHPPRLYSFESGYSPTGAMADHRTPVASRDIPALLAVLAAEVLRRDQAEPSDQPFARELEAVLSGLPLPRMEERFGGHREVITALADELHQNGEATEIFLGAHHPAEAHALTQLLRGHLHRRINAGPTSVRSRDSIAELIKAMRSGGVRTLLIAGTNPVHTAPVDLDFAGALESVPLRVRLGLQEDETSAVCTWHLPATHALEQWDLLDGVFDRFTVQPLIAPLYEGRSTSELLSLLADTSPISGHELVRAASLGTALMGTPDAEIAWRRRLHDGRHMQSMVEISISAPAREVFGKDLLDLVSRSESPLGPNYLELNFAADSKVHDGRFANNGWLQELPDAITKLTWDNALMISPALAEEKGLRQGDMVELKYRERTLEVPVYVQPGQARYSMTLNLGYGRTAAGNVGNGVGFNAYLLRTSDALWGGAGARITPTGRSYTLACTQDHHAIDTRGYEERERRAHSLIREGTYTEHQEHPNFAEHMGTHHPPLRSLWEERGYEGHKWGMSIDLNSCTGCNACVIACQAENNISVVGKDEVKRGREMQWIRIDRYFSGDPASPTMAQQPMACVHCEMAPCEQVCPVAATVHSDEGLNVMVYNRCVGTRYCSNNCPYKVRRFNFFDNQDGLSEVEELAYNPEVTVRSRGVMEKCTYCVQRIEHVRITAKNERREIQDGEIVTACQQTCPTQAIVFGDLNDEKSELRQRVEDPRSYAVLAELNVKPRTTYMARLRNPNPRLVQNSGHDDEHTARSAGDEHAAGTTGESHDRSTQH